MATLLIREFGRRRSRPLVWAAVVPPSILAIVVALLISLGPSDGSTTAAMSLSSATDVVISATTAMSAAGLAPSVEGMAFGSSDGCDRLGISGDLVGEQASPHEVFKAYLDLCLAK